MRCVAAPTPLPPASPGLPTGMLDHVRHDVMPTLRPQVELFGKSKGVIVCAPGRPLRPWFSVPDGCYALVTRFGKDEDYAEGQPIWPAGFHFGPPWLKVAFLLTKQSVVFNMPVKGCKTADNVTVQINLVSHSPPALAPRLPPLAPCPWPPVRLQRRGEDAGVAEA